MWTPNWLYEKLPLMYLLVGVLCVWTLGPSVASVLSALALLTACVLTVHLRRAAREHKTPHRHRRSGRR